MRMCACRGTAGIAHVSCGGAGEDFVRRGLGEQFGGQGVADEVGRWYTCGLCEQGHGVGVRARMGVLGRRRGPAGG